MNIIVSQEIETVCPQFIGACVEAYVVNTPYCEELWNEIHQLGEKYREQHVKYTAPVAKILLAIALHQKLSFAECCKAKNCIKETR